MAKEKKRPSKTAKAALKMLNDSKLLATAKAAKDLENDQNFKAEPPLPKQSAPIKVRPEKKRG
ncbi:MAG: hypothetical protein ABI891_15435 [Acidobacteriota bacterium]